MHAPPARLVIGEDPDRLLTYGEFAAWASVPERTARLWVASGTGPRTVRLGRHVRIRASDALRWLDDRYQESA